MMIAELHSVLRRLVYERGQIAPDEVALTFERPSRVWYDTLTRPTLNFFLYGIEENSDFRNARGQVTRTGKTATVSGPTYRIDVNYMISAFSTIAADEHALIWRTLALLLRHPALPQELLSERLRAFELSILTRLPRLDDDFDFWKAVELEPRPCLRYTVVLPLDPHQVLDVPLVLTRTTRMVRPTPEDEAAGKGMQRGHGIELAASLRIGGQVLDQQGRPVVGAQLTIEGRALAPVHTNEEGRFTLGPLQPGQLTLRVTLPDAEERLVPLIIPSERYDIVID
ncbi:Pvc16 family protein [Candidatus Viridilinea mediisalina]|nr:Pvc16 family protein [Candidatus Viridilinea mediisalina]